ncbi:hypothetical protein [Candidatus Poriferisocius sp.]|uniref:hypothetical protein n=1 Tax=Candidatus Poriferisocius sp. TaxID=3101276 RepID=UPI003B02A8A8
MAADTIVTTNRTVRRNVTMLITTPAIASPLYGNPSLLAVRQPMMQKVTLSTNMPNPTEDRVKRNL